MPPSPDLTPSESALLVVLMTEARPVSNKDLADRFGGLTLDGASRRKLNALKYVESWREGRMFVHQLGEQGWARCREGLNFDSPRARALGAALTSLLAGVHRYLAHADRSLAEMFAPDLVAMPDPVETPRPAGADGTDLPGRLRALYAELASEPGAWVGLATLRARLGDQPRAAVDAALRQLERAADVNIVPQSNQKALTAEDRGSAVRIGGQDKHFLAIGV
ncbi:hypothetical protein O7627_16510 [Solwaraspora sp. WMMD1047]|uniref:hypothetical protein n=1 Tax=Solwaraspora sp. WMMD1047 TaxID=3016102 RepID=UPI002416D47E|nr:hypothetical protein [Solwaraspora sp. WMMD1047]MDG4830900.1 hypothetical protein [Solwaraspora sp. WMMD1047]